MSSPITEVKPSQVAQLMKENEKLTEENEKLKEDIKKLRMWYNEREEDTKERLMMRKCQVKDLKEEKEKLKEEIEYVDKYINIITSTIEVGMLEDINDKIKEIKEENEKLDQRLQECIKSGNRWREKFMILEASAIKHLGEGFNDYIQ